jgi:hypothetical protein
MSNELIPEPKSNTSIDVFSPPKEDEELQFDLDYARRNVLDLIETGVEGAKQLADIADSSQNSLAYERLSALLKTVSDLNKDLVSISVQKQETRKPKTDTGPNITNNNLFVGTPAQLQDMLKQIEKK